MIPEFVGRFNSIANCNELTVEDLVDILTKPKNAIIKQYQHLFAEENVKLEFTQAALEAMAKKAKETGTGARALRMIAEGTPARPHVRGPLRSHHQRDRHRKRIDRRSKTSPRD